MNSNEIRQQFLDYFASKGHTLVPSSPLVPANDPTLLFTNAGMVQFKDTFLGIEQRSYRRATSAQRCVRAGGKHNDLENVGYTARHHTFFEMLGNFSFGDYFKRDAIQYAWEFLTEILRISPEKLWITVYHEDTEAADIWLNDIGVAAARLTRINDKPGAKKYHSDNFWQMGDTGPCGPCSEIFYDHGPEVAGGPPGTPEADGDRYVEIWNLVFMQYNRDEQGVLHSLPKPSVDTGMGLERITAVIQGVRSNYDIALFQDLIRAAARVTGASDLSDNSLKVIADHIRACVFLIIDGVMPSNEGRGYVLRRIIRRAIRHGYKLGRKQPFFHELVVDLAVAMGAAYPELTAAQVRVAAVLQQEEERFAETLDHGMAVLEAAMRSEDRMLRGETVFRLYDTYGFPLDLTADVARERGITVDFAGFQDAMEKQRTRARVASKFIVQNGLEYQGGATEFTGYDRLEDDSEILAIYRDSIMVETVQAGDEAVIILDRTPFYAESGGQAGDRGELACGGGSFQIDNTHKIRTVVFGHKGVVQTGRLAIGDRVRATVNKVARQRTALNHSATHLLHAALRQVLGDHVSQKGSLVDANRLRFDFPLDQALTVAQVSDIERLVNREIRHNHAVDIRLMKHDQAIKAGAMALFGEKYGEEVRVVRMGDFSVELCGGTHVQRTGDVGIFKIITESGVAAGVRRIEAVTGNGALDVMQQQQQRLNDIAALLKTPPQELESKLAQIMDNARAAEKELSRLKSKLASAQGNDLAGQVVAVSGVKVLSAALDGVDTKALRETVDQLKDKLKSCIVVLAAAEDGKVSLVAGVTADITARVHAGELVNFVAKLVGGKGGGRCDMAQAGGTDPRQLSQALASVEEWVRDRLGAVG